MYLLKDSKLDRGETPIAQLALRGYLKHFQCFRCEKRNITSYIFFIWSIVSCCFSVLKNIIMNKKSILIKQKHHSDLVRLSDSFDTSISGLVESMIDYFRKTGINPKDEINEEPTTLIKKLDKRIISFLKVQERDILKPMRTDVFEYQKISDKNTDSLMEQMKKIIVRVFEIDKSRTNSIIEENKKISEALLILASAIENKNRSGLLESIKTIFNSAD